MPSKPSMTSPTSALSAALSTGLSGQIKVPGDKSISHRALIFGALAQGVTRVSGLLEGDDVLHTGAQLRALGVSIEKEGADYVIVGEAWAPPGRPLYAGNAGTGVRLLIGALAGQGITATFDGDASLRGRPMGRVLDPLGKMGLSYSSRDGGLPVRVDAAPLKAITYRLPKPSAQVKSALLLAGLGATGVMVVEEPIRCRDHTEKMLVAFGVKLDIKPLGNGGRTIRMAGGQTLTATDIIVPGDPSSAAFPIVAALICQGSDVTVEGVLLNPERAGLYDTLIEMGAKLSFANERTQGGERVADMRAQYSPDLKGVAVPEARAASMIDEYPILAVAAACANGETFMPGLEELRVKESDRLAAVEAMLLANGVSVSSGPDWLRVTGGKVGGKIKGGGLVATHHDHRIAMSALVLGLVAEQPVSLDSGAMIATSFPNFLELMTGLGAKLSTHTS